MADSVANQLPTVFRASFRSTKRPATTATNSQLSILSPDFLPYRDLETSITALVDSNAFALSLPLFLLSDLLSKHQVVNSIVRLELEPPAT